MSRRFFVMCPKCRSSQEAAAVAIIGRDDATTVGLECSRCGALVSEISRSECDAGAFEGVSDVPVTEPPPVDIGARAPSTGGQFVGFLAGLLFGQFVADAYRAFPRTSTALVLYKKRRTPERFKKAPRTLARERFEAAYRALRTQNEAGRSVVELVETAADASGRAGRRADRWLP